MAFIKLLPRPFVLSLHQLPWWHPLKPASFPGQQGEPLVPSVSLMASPNNNLTITQGLLLPKVIPNHLLERQDPLPPKKTL